MSVKLYNGFIMNRISTLDRAWEILSSTQTRKIIREAVKVVERDTLAEEVCAAWDNRVLYPHCNTTQEETLRPYSFYRSQFRKTLHPRPTPYVLSNEEPDPLFGKNAIEIVLYPIKYEGNSYILGTYYIDNRNLANVFTTKLKCVREFAYWDNTDRPSHISRIRWKRRKEMWKIVLDAMTVPNRSGVTINLTPWDWDRSEPTDKEIREVIPLPKDRARALAVRYLKSDEMGRYMRLFRDMDEEYYTKNMFSLGIHMMSGVQPSEQEVQYLAGKIAPLLLDFREVNLSGRTEPL